MSSPEGIVQYKSLAESYRAWRFKARRIARELRASSFQLCIIHKISRGKRASRDYALFGTDYLVAGEWLRKRLPLLLVLDEFTPTGRIIRNSYILY